MGESWFAQLAQARASLGISQEDLAARSHVSAASIRAYETGKRHPSRVYLTAILDALKLDHASRNVTLAAAGYVPDGPSLPMGEPRGTFSRSEATTLVHAARWPAFVIDEFTSIIAANDLAQRIWGVDLREEFTDPLDRNLLSVASNPRFADRCLNWEEAVSLIVAVFKRKEWGEPERIDAPSPPFAAVLERFLNGDSKYVARLIDIWQKVPAGYWDEKMRWSYPVVWNQPGAGVIRFECVVTVASHADCTNFNDWVPVGSDSWSVLERLLG
jgi:transcriptional regulator with XRE-family HTH domain